MIKLREKYKGAMISEPSEFSSEFLAKLKKDLPDFFNEYFIEE
jgi:hypothetical protein